MKVVELSTRRPTRGPPCERTPTVRRDRESEREGRDWQVVYRPFYRVYIAVVVQQAVAMAQGVAGDGR